MNWPARTRLALRTALMTIDLEVAADLRGVVRPGWFVATGVTVLDVDVRLDEPLRGAAAAMRLAPEPAEVIAAVRTMY